MVKALVPKFKSGFQTTCHMSNAHCKDPRLYTCQMSSPMTVVCSDAEMSFSWRLTCSRGHKAIPYRLAGKMQIQKKRMTLLCLMGFGVCCMKILVAQSVPSTTLYSDCELQTALESCLG